MAYGTRLASLFLALSLALGPAMAALAPDEMLDDPELEQRARAISLEVRCLVCQNQSIDDSDAPLARDLRLLIRERLVAGESDREVMDFLVARYGEFVLMRPRLAPHTVVLWGAPVLLLALGIVGVAMALRRRRNIAATESLNEEEERAVARILEERDPRPRQ
jgi:cytochrome c-type biogenesis protein CcmH